MRKNMRENEKLLNNRNPLTVTNVDHFGTLNVLKKHILKLRPNAKTSGAMTAKKRHQTQAIRCGSSSP